MRGAGALLAGLLGALPAAAEEPLAARVQALEAGHGIVLRAPASEDAALVAEVEAGLAALPPALRRPPGGPLELVLHGEAAPLGLGDGTPERSDWTDGRSRFHLYAQAPSDERRATYRLSALTDEEVARLWRRRAVVHAVMQRWDDARDFSGTRRWRRLSGWQAPLERPLVFKEQSLLTYAGAYSRARGQASASLDFVTFTEELFVPVESLRPEALSVDDRVVCQEFSKARAVGELLAADGLAVLPPRGPCPAFDKWAEEAGLSHFEVLMVAATGRQPESLFGHLLLRPVWREGEHVRGPGLERAVQLVALTGLEGRGPSYMVRGLTGGFSLGFVTTSLGDMAHEAQELEQRTLRRYRLGLTHAEGVRLLERVWEMERRGYLDYYFFTDNCATALLFLLNGSLEGGREVRAPHKLWVLPTATLDALASARVVGPEGGDVPLLEHVPDDLESTSDRAARAFRTRREALESLDSRISAEAHARLRLLNLRLEAPSPALRREAYGRLPEAVSGALSSARAGEEAAVRGLLHAYVAHSVRVERAAVDRAEGERLEIERARVIALRTPVPGGAGAGVRERQALFEREDDLQRKLAVLDRTELLREALARAPRRDLTPDEARTLAQAEAVEATFIAATETQGALNDGVLGAVDARDFLVEDSARKVEAERAWSERALVSSGAARTVVGVGVDVPEEGAARPVVMVRTAGLSESLGDARRHGFQPGSELRVLDGELLLEPRWGLPRIRESKLTLVGYRTLRRDLPPLRRSAWDELGWGMAARVESAESRALAYRATLQGEALMVVDEAPRFERFTALGLGAQAGMRWSEHVLVPAAGPRVSLAHRTGLGGALANSVRLEAAYAPVWMGDGTLSHEAAAEVQVELWLGRLGGLGVLFTPRAQARWEGELSAWEGRSEQRVTMGLEVR
ncbi:DUF4105 domain-containing protein [Myxococcaceae bacterium GXIMD 01537]